MHRSVRNYRKENLVPQLKFRVVVRVFEKKRCLFSKIDPHLGSSPLTTGEKPDLEPAVRPIPISKNKPLMGISRGVVQGDNHD